MLCQRCVNVGAEWFHQYFGVSIFHRISDSMMHIQRHIFNDTYTYIHPHTKQPEHAMLGYLERGCLGVMVDKIRAVGGRASDLPAGGQRHPVFGLVLVPRVFPLGGTVLVVDEVHLRGNTQCSAHIASNPTHAGTHAVHRVATPTHVRLTYIHPSTRREARFLSRGC